MHAWLAIVTLLAAPEAQTSDLAGSVTAAESTLTAAGLRPGEPDYDGTRARKSGLDPERLAGHLDVLSAACTDPAATCTALQAHMDLRDRLAHALGELGTLRQAASLQRSSRRGSFAADQALDRLRAQAMIEALPRARCSPPTSAELAAAAAGLADFLVVRVRGGVSTAEPLTPYERADLAYFLVAVGDAGREVGAPAEASSSDPTNPGTQDAQRSEALARLQADMYAGDLTGSIAAGRRYLATLGYPRPMDRAADADHAWGGARHSFVMRDVAAIAELTGELTLAYDLYRRADPGGGACGTSYWSYWRDQVGGVIRSAERLGDCRPALAERLLDIDLDAHSGDPPDPLGLGTGRLAAAGFDLPRLFRGALLTLGRDDEAKLRAVLAAAPASLRSAALARLARRGSEDWARRVYAIEGMAATGDARTLTALADLLATVAPADQARIATAIGEAGERPPQDPCAPQQGFGGGSWSNVWTRPVPRLARSCKGSLTLAQSEALAQTLLPLALHGDEPVQSAAITALGELAVTSAAPTLRRLARLAPTRPCEDEDSCAALRRHEAAVVAVAALDTAVGDGAWRRRDHQRGG